MKEIEILVEVYDDIQTIKNALKNYDYIGLKHTIDEYYYDPKREDLKPDNNNQLSHCLRLRSKNNDYLITYKDDVFENGKWLYSNEYETRIESKEVLKEILDKLGLKKLIEIDNEKEIYKTDKYEIALENVKDLGLFMEVEYCTSDDVDVDKIKNEIQLFIDSLNIKVSKELNMGKPEMYLRKHNIRID
jgi:predicted adenylyl cyclase CyaB